MVWAWASPSAASDGEPQGQVYLDPDFHDGLKVDLRFPAVMVA
jgi:hypothetical protein